MKLFIPLQTPTIELPVVATDAAGEKHEILVGFKRYTYEQSKNLQEELKETLEQNEDVAEDNSLIDSIIYIKNARIDAYEEQEDGTYVFKETIKIPDTRKVKPSNFWGSEQECLSALVEHYLNSLPWRLGFRQSFFQSITNIPLANEAKEKN